jgi:c-di-GMP-binding flagellar brake protein YcgR
MTQKVYITRSNLVTFTCPKCEQPRVINIADHPELEKTDKAKVKCPCGHKYSVMIERRKQYRISTNFAGEFRQIVEGREEDRGLMTVLDMSRTGLKIKLNVKRELKVGDKLFLEFRLDDAQRTLIQKEVVIKKIFGLELGVEFTSIHPSNPSDRALGFYMFG